MPMLSIVLAGIAGGLIALGLWWIFKGRYE